MSTETVRPLIMSEKKPVFPNEFNSAEESLSKNGLVNDFIEIKKLRRSEDIYMPNYHYVNSFGILNDPNGLCYWKGNWHLFYQQFVQAPDGGQTIYWGHAVSADLMKWTELPYAIYPSPEAQCWSGATCVEEDRVIAMYYGYGNEEGLYIAISTDPLLLNWEKKGPVIKKEAVNLAMPHCYEPDKNAKQNFNVFDPCIWKQHDGYYALTGGVTSHPVSGKQIRNNYVLFSKDLEKWEYLHNLTDDCSFSEIGDDGACPYFLPLNDSRLLLYYCHSTGAKYLLGKYDEDKAKLLPFNGGRINGTSQRGGYCAPSGFPLKDGSVRSIYVMHSDCGASLMSIPHTLTLGGEYGDSLCIKPAIDLSPYYIGHSEAHNIKLIKNCEQLLDGITVNSSELSVELTDKDMPCLEFRICRSEDGREFTSVFFYPFRGSGIVIDDSFPRRSIVAVDCSNSSLSDNLIAPPETREILLRDDESLKLKIFVDKSVIEIFINDREVIGRRFFPSKGSTGVSIISHGKDAVIDSISVNQISDLNTTLNLDALNKSEVF